MELRDVSVTSQFERQHTIGLRIEWRRLTSDDAPSLSLAAYKTTTKRLGNEETNESTNRHNILSILRDVVFVPRVRRTKQNCSSSFLFFLICAGRRSLLNQRSKLLLTWYSVRRQTFRLYRPPFEINVDAYVICPAASADDIKRMCHHLRGIDIGTAAWDSERKKKKKKKESQKKGNAGRVSSGKELRADGGRKKEKKKGAGSLNCAVRSTRYLMDQGNDDVKSLRRRRSGVALGGKRINHGWEDKKDLLPFNQWWPCWFLIFSLFSFSLVSGSKVLYIF